MPTAVLDIDLAPGFEPVQVAEKYARAFIVVRWEGRPVGAVRAPLRQGRLHEADFITAIAGLRQELMRAAAAARLATAGDPDGRALPATSVVICTRDRASDLRRCLDSLAHVSATETIVVDNAPPNDSTRNLVAGYPSVRYVLEPRAGLCFARQRGLLSAGGDVVAFVDDDTVVDRGWFDALRAPFVHPATAAATGKVLPLELETEAQEIFEHVFGGFGRGFAERDFSATRIHPLGAGGVGAGANMALRRDLALRLGLFKPHLDTGTPVESGGETYAFYRLLMLGHRIRYVPTAIVWHKHRREMRELQRQLRGYATGVYAFWLRCLFVHGDFDSAGAIVNWLRGYNLRGLRRALRRRPDALPLRLVLSELSGCARAPLAYARCRFRERRDVAVARGLEGR